MSDQAQAVDPVAAIAGILQRQSEPPKQEAAPEPDDSAPETVETDETPIEAATDEDAPTAEQAEAADDSEDVDYEGESYRVPKKLKDALLRQADYTRKTQEVAEQKRLVEARFEHIKAQEVALQEHQQFMQSAAQEAAEIKASESTLKQYQQIDWNALSDSDPVQAQKLWIGYQTQQQRHNELLGAFNSKGQQFQQAQQQRKAELLQKGVEVLKKDIPGWGPELAASIMKTGKENYGFTDAELSNLYDPRMVKVLADAYAYRKLQQSKPEINKRAATVPKTIQPSAQQTNKTRQAQAVNDAKARLRKTGKVEDAAAVFARIL